MWNPLWADDMIDRWGESVTCRILLMVRSGVPGPRDGRGDLLPPPRSPRLPRGVRHYIIIIIIIRFPQRNKVKHTLHSCSFMSMWWWLMLLRYKYWSCCCIRTMDFNAFLDQKGCDTGKHRWIPRQVRTRPCSEVSEWERSLSWFKHVKEKKLC